MTRARAWITTSVAMALLVFAGCASAPAADQNHRPPLGVASIATLADRTPAGYDREAAVIRSLGAEWIRIVVNWNEIETAPGVYSWNRIDEAVAAARQHRLRVLANVIGPAPPWYAGPNYSGASPPLVLGAVDGFFGRVATRFRQDVAAWEVWNEQNAPAFWASPDPVAYARVLEAASRAIRRNAPGTEILMGGVTTGPGAYPPVPFVDRVLQSVDEDTIGGVAVHPYSFPDAPNRDPLRRIEVVDSIRKVIDRSKRPTLRIWVTEFGQPTGPLPLGVTDDEQAARIGTALKYFATRTGMGPVFLYTSRDWSPDPTNPELNFGLYRFDWTPKPAVGVVLQWVTSEEGPS